jgi:hypothetical protein
MGAVTFQANHFIVIRNKEARKAKARQLAAEIVDFVEAHPAQTKSETQLYRHKEFDASIAMHALLSSIRFSRWLDAPAPICICDWSCSNITTKHISVSESYIKSAIRQKNRKAASYNWHDAEEKWLLIVAGGGHVNTCAPRLHAGVKWDEPDLKQLCAESPFDKIVFWNRVHQWQRWIK